MDVLKRLLGGGAAVCFRMFFFLGLSRLTRATACEGKKFGEITNCDRCSAVRMRVSAWRLYGPARITSRPGETDKANY